MRHNELSLRLTVVGVLAATATLLSACSPASPSATGAAPSATVAALAATAAAPAPTVAVTVPSPAVAASPSSAPQAASAAAPSANGSNNSPIRVAFFAPVANTYVAATLKGLNEVSVSGGTQITQFDTGFDAQKEFSQIQDATTTGKFDAFVIIPLDSVGLVPAAQAAIKQGILVVNTDLVLGPATDTSQPQIDGQLASIVNPPSTRAARTLDGIVSACKDLNPCNVGFMAGAPSLDFEQVIKQGLDALPTNNPNIKIKSYQTGHGYLAAPAIPIAQNILQANPDVNVLAVSSDQATLGAEQAVNSAGKAGQIRLVSAGGSCPAVDAVKAGRFYLTIADLPETEGRLAMQAIADALRNGKKGPIGENAVASIKDPIITKDSAGGFQCEWEG